MLETRQIDTLSVQEAYRLVSRPGNASSSSSSKDKSSDLMVNIELVHNNLEFVGNQTTQRQWTDQDGWRLVRANIFDWKALLLRREEWDISVEEA